MDYENWEDLEFVIFDGKGEEVETYDPVVSATEYEDIWVVDNYFHIYDIPKKESYKYIIRTKDKE